MARPTPADPIRLAVLISFVSHGASYDSHIVLGRGDAALAHVRSCARASDECTLAFLEANNFDFVCHGDDFCADVR